MQKLSSPDHPIWDLAELLVAVLIVAIVLWHNASNFDSTETISIGQIATLLGIVFAARSGLRIASRRKGDGERTD
jgi:hypothetical protein